MGTAGSSVNQSVIRRSLSDYPLSTSPRFASAWSAIDRLGLRLRDQSGRRSAPDHEPRAGASNGADPGGSRHEVAGDRPDRSSLRVTLTSESRAVPPGSGRAYGLDGTAVTSLSLRDLPQSPPSSSALGGHLDEVLAAGATAPLRLLVVDGAEIRTRGQGCHPADACYGSDEGRHRRRRCDSHGRVAPGSGRSVEIMRIGWHCRETLRASRRAFSTRRTRSGGSDLSRPCAAAWRRLEHVGSSAVPAWLTYSYALDKRLEPAKFLCEADVFAAVWRSLIRNEEYAAGTASPDDRERAALSVAKRALGLPSEHVPGTASAELRSDGVLTATE